ncbi:MAG TPA: hypothetical protein PKI01_10425 [Bacteroidales bacterium]|nr:hypothetical protein [Bacteroidales bacterium]
MPIDTDDLSEKTYRAIIIEAEKFNHDLTLQFGLLSYHCMDEDEYIKLSKEYIAEMLEFDEFDLDDIFFGNPPPMKDFHAALNRIIKNISTLETK